MKSQEKIIKVTVIDSDDEYTLYIVFSRIIKFYPISHNSYGVVLDELDEGERSSSSRHFKIKGDINNLIKVFSCIECD